MSTRLCMRVSRWLVVVVSGLTFAPAGAEAAPVLTGNLGTVCGSLAGESPNCQLFDVGDPLAGPLSLTGEFLINSDVAVFRFSLAAQASVSAFVGGIGGFDPLIGLFGATGQILTYFDADLGDFTDAENDDRIPGVDFNAELPSLLLEADTPYFLALIQTGNTFSADLDGVDNLSAGFAWDLDEFAQGSCVECGFTVAITTTTPSASVPEPGTLSLLTLGAAAAAIARRRRRHAPRA